MNPLAKEPTVLVEMPVKFVDALLMMRDSLDTGLFKSLAVHSSADQLEEKRAPEIKTVAASLPRHYRYSVEYLGETIGCKYLYEAFGSVVDLTATLAPEALEELANMKADTRRYVARKPEAIHPGSPYLPVIQTNSGW